MPRSRWARVAMWVTLSVHAALLLCSLRDYPVSIDAGYQVSLARWYGEHGTGVKVYVAPLPPQDPLLADFERRGWLTIRDGSATSSVYTLAGCAPLESVTPVVGRAMSVEAAWLAKNAKNNTAAPESVVRSAPALAVWKAALMERRTRMGRAQTAMLVHAYALEPVAPETARGFRGAVRGFGSTADFLGDDACIGYVSDARHGQLRENLAALAVRAGSLSPDLTSLKPFGAALRKLFGECFTAA